MNLKEIVQNPQTTFVDVRSREEFADGHFPGATNIPLQEIVDKQYYLSLHSNQRDVGQTYKVLIEGNSKKDESSWMGRSSQNKVIVFPKENYDLKKGDYVMVKVNSCTKGTLLGTIANQ